MKKILSTLLILAMVLTMALTVSAAASIATLFTGNYIAYVQMPGGNMPMYEVSFTPSNASQGTFDIVDNYTTQYTGTYSYSVDSTDTVTVMAGTDDISSVLNFKQDNGELTLVIRGTDYPLTASTGSITPQNPELVIGANAIDVEVVNNFCAGVDATFTATEAGTYILSVADDEDNASVAYYGDPNDYSDDVWDVFEEGDYEFTLAAGESITFNIATSDVMLTEDTIDLVLTKQGAQGGGNAGGGSVNTGDNVALYVAVGAVALASIFGCAIVSKKRVTE